jgi:Tfp pilus assembly protein PilN
MRAINLLPKDDGRRGGPSLSTPVAITIVAGLIFVTALLGLLYSGAHGKVKSRRLELSQKQAELAAIPVPAQSQLQQQDALVADKQARVTALNLALSKRVAWDRVFREFALVLPDDVWLVTLSATAPVTATATTTPTPAASTSTSTSSSTSSSAPTTSLVGTLGFNLEGYTYSHDAVARLLTRLAVVPDLEQVQLLTSEKAKLGARTVIHFTIAANVRAPGASS